MVAIFLPNSKGSGIKPLTIHDVSGDELDFGTRTNDRAQIVLMVRDAAVLMTGRPPGEFEVTVVIAPGDQPEG